MLDRGDCIRHGGEVADVRLDTEGLHTGLFDQPEGLSQVARLGQLVRRGLHRLADVDGHDRRAVGSQSKRMRSALAAGGTRNDRNFVVQRPHPRHPSPRRADADTYREPGGVVRVRDYHQRPSWIIDLVVDWC